MFRFSIRELTLVMVIAGVALGWWADRRRVAERLEYLEWKNGDVFTVNGQVWNMDTLSRVLAEDDAKRKRFAGQAVPKSQAAAKAKSQRNIQHDL
jgi:hypothetical protein